MTGESKLSATVPPVDNTKNLMDLREAVSEVSQLGNNVRDGKVSLDPTIGAELLATLRSHAQDIADWQQQVGTLAQPLPMGNNPVGLAMSKKFSMRADGDQTSLGVVLAQYHDTVVAAGDAIEQAMQRYQSTEDEARQSFKRISAT